MTRFYVRIREMGDLVRFDLKYSNRYHPTKAIEWQRRDLLLKREYFDLLAIRKIFYIDHDNQGYTPQAVSPKTGIGMNVKSIGNTIRFDLSFAPRVYKLWDNIDAKIPDLILTDWDFQEMVYRLRAISQYKNLGIVEDVHEAIRLGENERIEFKRDFLYSKQKVLKSVVAFANSQNGNLFLGVSDHGEIYGIDHELEQYKSEDKYLLAITSYLQEKITPDINPFPLIRIIDVDGKKVLHLFVQASNELYCYLDSNNVKRVVVRMNNQSATIDDPHDIGMLYMEKKRTNHL